MTKKIKSISLDINEVTGCAELKVEMQVFVNADEEVFFYRACSILKCQGYLKGMEEHGLNPMTIYEKLALQCFRLDEDSNTFVNLDLKYLIEDLREVMIKLETMTRDEVWE